MTNRERAKGVAGERECASLWTAAGATVRGLEGLGDHLIVVADESAHVRHLIHEETKRQERLQLWQWIAQAEAETEPGAVAVVSFRRNRSPWYSCLQTERLAGMLSR